MDQPPLTNGDRLMEVLDALDWEDIIADGPDKAKHVASAKMMVELFKDSHNFASLMVMFDTLLCNFPSLAQRVFTSVQQHYIEQHFSKRGEGGNGSTH